MSQSQGQPDFDLDEDLFDFDAVSSGSAVEDETEDLEEIFASFRDASSREELLAVPTVPGGAGALPAPIHAHPEPTEKPHAAARAPAASRTHDEAASTSEPASLTGPRPPFPSGRSPRVSRSVIAIALAATTLNSILAVVVLSGRGGGGSSDVGVALEPAHERGLEDGAHAAPPQPQLSTRPLPDPEGVEAVHAHPALDQARAEIARGEFAGARQRVYALLAIIDRLEEPRRGALEADCQFLIAQALHLEALARMGGEE